MLRGGPVLPRRCLRCWSCLLLSYMSGLRKPLQRRNPTPTRARFPSYSQENFPFSLEANGTDRCTSTKRTIESNLQHFQFGNSGYRHSMNTVKHRARSIISCCRRLRHRRLSRRACSKESSRGRRQVATWFKVGTRADWRLLASVISCCPVNVETRPSSTSVQKIEIRQALATSSPMASTPVRGSVIFSWVPVKDMVISRGWFTSYPAQIMDTTTLTRGT